MAALAQAPPNLLLKLGHQRGIMEMILVAAEPQPTNCVSLLESPEDVWRQQREAAMIRACRILEIPYKPEYAEIGR